MVNPWFVHLSAFRKANPNLSMKEAMHAAKKTYKKSSVGTKKGMVRKTARRAYMKVKKSRKSKKSRKGTKKGMVRKTARRAYKK